MASEMNYAVDKYLELKQNISLSIFNKKKNHAHMYLYIYLFVCLYFLIPVKESYFQIPIPSAVNAVIWYTTYRKQMISWWCINELRIVVLLGCFLLEEREWRDGKKRGLDRISRNWKAANNM